MYVSNVLWALITLQKGPQKGHFDTVPFVSGRTECINENLVFGVASISFHTIFLAIKGTID